MKKLIIVAAVVLTASFTSCSQQGEFNSSKTEQIKALLDDASNFNTVLKGSNKLDISQADGNI